MEFLSLGVKSESEIGYDEIFTITSTTSKYLLPVRFHIYFKLEGKA